MGEIGQFVRDLAETIANCIEDWQNENHADKFTANTCTAETLIAIVEMISFQIACVPCARCRAGYADSARYHVLAAIDMAEGNPIPANAS
jgi:hypothetical protein